jgi:hypothetical protein
MAVREISPVALVSAILFRALYAGVCGWSLTRFSHPAAAFTRGDGVRLTLFRLRGSSFDAAGFTSMLRTGILLASCFGRPVARSSPGGWLHGLRDCHDGTLTR